MSSPSSSEAGAPRSAIWRRLIEQWREKGAWLDTIHATMGTGYHACADDLETALLACADALAPSPDKGEVMELPDIEVVAAKVHEAWMETKRQQGITSRPAADGTEQMVPYADLPDALQELDRATVRAVYAAIEASAK